MGKITRLYLAFGAYLIALSPCAMAASIPVKSQSIVSPVDKNPQDLRRIDLLSTEECLAAVKALLDPEGIIREGLSALNGPEISATNLACVDDILTNWDQYKSPRVPLAPKEPHPALKPPVVDDSLESAISAELRCYNPDPAGSPEHDAYKKEFAQSCAGKWLSPEESTRLKARLAQEELKNQILRAKRGFQGSNLNAAMQLAWMSQPSAYDFKLSNGKSLNENLSCFNEFAEGTPEHAAFLKEKSAPCGGKFINEEEKAALLDEHGKAYKPVYAEALSIQPYLNELLVVNPRAQIFVMGRRLACFAEHEEGSPAAAMHRKINETDCAGFGFPAQSELPAYQKKITRELEKLMPQIRHWMKRKSLLAEEQAREYERLNPGHYQDYGTKRLLARLKPFLANAATPKDVQQFCETYHRDQLRDLNYAEQGFDVAPFDSDQDWENAAAFGFSEGEYAAIRAYTGSFYRQINRALWKAKERGTALSSSLTTYQNIMGAALDRLPSYYEPVRRFTALPPPVLAEHEVGKIVTYAAYTSTSGKEDWKWEASNAQVTHGFVIYGGPGGKNIAQVSTSEHEQEVLFRPGTRFKVVSRTPQPGKTGVFNFVMVEVDEAGRALGRLPDSEKKEGSP